MRTEIVAKGDAVVVGADNEVEVAFAGLERDDEFAGVVAQGGAGTLPGAGHVDGARCGGFAGKAWRKTEVDAVGSQPERGEPKKLPTVNGHQAGEVAVGGTVVYSCDKSAVGGSDCSERVRRERGCGPGVCEQAKQQNEADREAGEHGGAFEKKHGQHTTKKISRDL